MYILHAVSLLRFTLPAATHDGVDIRRAGARPLQLPTLRDALNRLYHRRNREEGELRDQGVEVTDGSCLADCTVPYPANREVPSCSGSEKQE